MKVEERNMTYFLWIGKKAKMPKVPYLYCYRAKSFNQAKSFVKDCVKPGDYLIVSSSKEKKAQKFVKRLQKYHQGIISFFATLNIDVL